MRELNRVLSTYQPWKVLSIDFCPCETEQVTDLGLWNIVLSEAPRLVLLRSYSGINHPIESSGA